MKEKIRKGLALTLAAVLVLGSLNYLGNNYLKATDEGAVEENVEEQQLDAQDVEETQDTEDAQGTDEKSKFEVVVEEGNLLQAPGVKLYDGFEYTNMTLFDQGGDYSLFFILNNYNIFSEGDVITSHCVGPAAVGGTAAFRNHQGTQGFTQPTLTYMKGEIIEPKGGFWPVGVDPLILGTANAENSKGIIPKYRGYKVYISQNDDYIDFNAAMNSMTQEMNDIRNSSDVIEIDFSKPVADHYIITEAWGGQYSLEAEPGFVYKFKDGEIGKFREVRVNDDKGNAIFYSDDAVVTHPDVLLKVNGSYTSDWAPLSTHSIEYGGNVAALFFYPNATEVNRGSSYDSFNGHVVAPNALVASQNGARNGCTVCASYNNPNAESHMWPYNGDKVNPASTELKAKKTVNGKTPKEGQVFEFKLHQTAGPTENTKFIEDRTVVNSGEAVNFGSIEYAKEGEYVYEITETGKTPTTTGEYTIDTTKYTAKVVVSKSSRVLPSQQTEITYTVDSVKYYKGSTEIGSATFNNLGESGGTGDLEVKKTVVSKSSADLKKSFHFKVELSDNTISGEYGSMTFTNGVAEFDLTNGKSLKATDLPEGITYTVTETNGEGFTQTWTGQTGSKDPQKGEIKKDDTATVVCKNTRETGGLKVSKTVQGGTSADKDKEFEFTVTIKTADGKKTEELIDGKFGDMTFDKGVATFKLKDGESKTATGLPIGLPYEVTETSASGFVTTSTGETGSIAAADNEGNYPTAAFTNTKDKGGLIVSKSVVSTLPSDKDLEFSFKVELGDKSITGEYGSGDTAMTFDKGFAEFKLKDGQTKVATDLPAGIDYKVTETNANGFTTESTGTTGKIQKNATTASFINTRDTGNLKVKKTVESTVTADHTKSFTFTVTLKDANGDVLNIGTKDAPAVYGEMSFEGGVATFTLADTEEKTATDLPVGIKYEVTETDGEGFVQAWTGQVGSADPQKGEIKKDETPTVECKNTRETGGLEVKKTVDSKTAADLQRDFHFKVELSDETISGKFGDMTFTKGVAEFDLQNGQSLKASGLPSGITYTVTETNGEGFTQTWTGQTGAKDPQKGEIKTDETPTVECKNTREVGGLEVKKKVESPSAADLQKSFHFKVELNDSTITGAYGGMTFDKGVAEFDLTNGQSKTATDLPAGLKYKVTETNGTGFTQTWTGQTGSTDPQQGEIKKDDTPTVECKNTRETGGLEVKKTVISKSSADLQKEFHFKVELSDNTINGKFGKMDFTNGVAEFDLTNGQSLKASGLPAGITYTVTETNGTGFTQTWTGQTGSTDPQKGEIKTDETPTVECKNTRETGGLTVSKTVQGGSTADQDVEFEFTVTIKTADGKKTEELIDGTFGDIKFDKGVATFKLKHGQSKTATGLPIGLPYEVTETSAEGFVTTSTGSTGDIAKADTSGKYPTAAFTNVKDQGGLIVSKSVVSPLSSDKDLEFSFKVVLSDESITGEYGSGDTAMTFDKGVAEFKLKDGQVKVATDLPTGIIYKVTETNADGFTTESTGTTGKIQKTAATAAFINTRELGNLEVKKTVESKLDSDHTKAFSFTVTLKDANGNTLNIGTKDAPAVFGEMSFEAGVASFTLADNETKTATGLPVGIFYEVVETDNDNFTVSWTGQTGSTDPQKGEIKKDETASVVCKNTRELGSLKITKNLDNFYIGDNEKAKSVSFAFRVEGFLDKNGNGTIDDTLDEKVFETMVGIKFDASGANSETLKNLPAGIMIRITEEYSGTAYVIDGENIKSATIVSDNTAEVSFSNKYDKSKEQSGVINRFEKDKSGSFAYNGKANKTSVDN